MVVVVPKIEDVFLLLLLLSLATASAAERLAFVAALFDLFLLLTAAALAISAAPAFAPFRLILPCPRSEVGKYVVLLASDKRPVGRSVIVPTDNDAPARFNCLYV